MTPQEQLRKEPNGDCLRAAVATLLDLPIHKVPDFVLAETPEGSQYPGFWMELQSWLNERGLWFLEMQLPANQPWMPIPFEGLCIFFGETEAGHRHAIVGKVGHMLHDQFISVYNPWPGHDIKGVGAIGFILPRDPANYMRLGRALAQVEKLSSEWAGVMAGPPAVGAKELRLGAIHATAKEALGT